MSKSYSFDERNFEVDPESDELSEFSEEFEDAEFDTEADAYELEEGEEEFDGEFEETQTRNKDVQKKIQQLRDAHAKLSMAVGAMGKHVAQSNGAHRLSLKARNAQDAAAKLRINPRLFALLHNAMTRRNAQLKAKGRGKSELELELEASAPLCAGRTEVSPRWWGIRIYLNECHTKALIEALKVGTGVAALCVAGFPAPQAKAVCGVLAALGTVGAAAIAGIDSLGGNKGIVISKVFHPATPPIVWHQ